MKLYTKTGDAGETGLYGGLRVAKDSLRVQAYGSVDEANAALGLVRAQSSDGGVNEDLAYLQNALFDLGADLATPLEARQRAGLEPIDEADIARLEALIDRYDAQLEPLKSFILPGGHGAAAALHLARTVVRRAEREVVALGREEDLNPQVRVFLNRLSDLLFVLARIVNMRMGVSETRWAVKGREQAASKLKVQG